MEASTSQGVARCSALRAIGYRPAEISGLFNTRVIEQHASEAAFHWTRRERAAHAPHYKLKHLAMLDERVNAHLHGLRVAGTVGWHVALAALERADAGGVFVVSWLAFASAHRTHMSHALQLALAQPSFMRAFEAALVWLEAHEARDPIHLLQASPTAQYQHLALGALAGHGIDPGDFLARTVESADAGLRARSLQVIGQLRRRDLTGAVRSQLADADASCHFWAAWALTLLGHPDGAKTLLDSPRPEPGAVDIALRFGDPQWARDAIRHLASQEGTLRLAIQAVASFGDCAAVGWLLEQMEAPQTARVAAEAFSLITGADLDYLGLKRDAPEEEPEASDDEDRDLPWPDTARLAHWWKARQEQFVRGQRYLLGAPIDPNTAHRVLREGYQRQRSAAAFELGRLNEAVPLFPVLDRADRQRKRLAA